MVGSSLAALLPPTGLTLWDTHRPQEEDGGPCAGTGTTTCPGAGELDSIVSQVVSQKVQQNKE